MANNGGYKYATRGIRDLVRIAAVEKGRACFGVDREIGPVLVNAFPIDGAARHHIEDAPQSQAREQGQIQPPILTDVGQSAEFRSRHVSPL